MKYCFLIIFLAGIAACKKPLETLPDAPGCISRIFIPATAHSISASEISTANGLFASNNISNGSYRYYQFVHDTFQTQYPPFTAYDEKLVKVDQYTNGLHIFNKQMNYVFFDDQIHFISGYRTKGTTADTIPHLTLSQLRGLFTRDLQNFEHTSRFNDSCMHAEFGYYDLHAGSSDTTEKLIKAWHITPAASSYPEAYYKDGTGERIYYFNGLFTL